MSSVDKLGESSALSWRINARGKYFVLRQARCTTRYLDFQTSVLEHLSRSGFPYEIPDIVRTRDGAVYVVDASGPWLLYHYLEGDDAGEPVSLVDARSIAELVACYGRAVATFDPARFAAPFRLELFNAETTFRTLADCGTIFRQHDDSGVLATLMLRDAEAMAGVYDRISAAEIAEVTGLPRTTVYNDWHRYNRVVRNGRIVGIVDFDSVAVAPRIVDFQNGLAYVLSALQQPTGEVIEAYSAAYTRILPLTRLELSLVYPVMLDRLAWMVADVVTEWRREGRSAREELAERFGRLLLWLLGHRADFEAALLRDAEIDPRPVQIRGS